MAELRKLMPYGYETYTGRVPNNYQVDRYNRVQKDVNAFIKGGMPIPEGLLNQSHRTFIEISTNL